MDAQTQTTREDNQPGAAFRKVKAIMSEPEIDISYAAPWTDREWELYVSQEPLPPNQSPSLPVEEQLEIAL